MQLHFDSRKWQNASKVSTTQNLMDTYDFTDNLEKSENFELLNFTSIQFANMYTMQDVNI